MMRVTQRVADGQLACVVVALAAIYFGFFSS
jgi:hypothetical protein